MRLPDLSRLSARAEARTDMLILPDDGSVPPPYAVTPLDHNALYKCIQDKVRPLVYTDQMRYDLIEGDLRLTEAPNSYLRNDIIPYGGQYLPGVVQACYDYKLLSPTRFKVTVHTTLQNGICGGVTSTDTREMEVEDQLYVEITQYYQFLMAVESAAQARDGNQQMVGLFQDISQIGRDQRANESSEEYSLAMTYLVFGRFERVMLYFHNMFREGEEGLVFTREGYRALLQRALANAITDENAIARDMQVFLRSQYPVNELYTPTLELDTVSYFNRAADHIRSRLASTERRPAGAEVKYYPYPSFTLRTTQADPYPFLLGGRRITPRAFWFLHVLQTVEKLLVEAIHDMLHKAPAPGERALGGAAFEMLRNEYDSEGVNGGGKRQRGDN